MARVIDRLTSGCRAKLGTSSWTLWYSIKIRLINLEYCSVLYVSVKARRLNVNIKDRITKRELGHVTLKQVLNICCVQ